MLTVKIHLRSGTVLEMGALEYPNTWKGFEQWCYTTIQAMRGESAGYTILGKVFLPIREIEYIEAIGIPGPEASQEVPTE